MFCVSLIRQRNRPRYFGISQPQFARWWICLTDDQLIATNLIALALLTITRDRCMGKCSKSMHSRLPLQILMGRRIITTNGKCSDSIKILCWENETKKTIKLWSLTHLCGIETWKKERRIGALCTTPHAYRPKAQSANLLLHCCEVIHRVLMSGA